MDRFEGELITETEIETLPDAVPMFQRAEVDMQIATAKKYPRSITAFKRQALEMATLDEETAAEMSYLVPRGGKKIEGPSIRLAEIAASCWRNIRFASRPVAVEQNAVTAEGVCLDLENNVAVSIQVRRRITDSKGRRYNEDMINMTMLAACAIARRDAILGVVPRVYVEEIREEAKRVSVGKGLTHEQRRVNALEAFVKMGATEAMVLHLLKRAGIADITTQDLIELRGIRTAIKDNMTTLAEVFHEEAASPEAQKSKSDKLAEALKCEKTGEQIPLKEGGQK